MPYPASAPDLRQFRLANEGGADDWRIEQMELTPALNLPDKQVYFLTNAAWRLRIPTPVGERLWTDEERPVTVEEIEAAFTDNREMST